MKSIINNSQIYAQILSNGFDTGSKSILITTDMKSYLINCGEGIQRAAIHNKITLSKLEEVFLTNNRWENYGGLIGLSLTIQDAGCKSLNIRMKDGRRINEILKKSFEFSRFNLMKLSTQSNLSFEDEIFRIEDILPTNDNMTNRSSCSILFQPLEIPGRLNPQKCILFNVPKGPSWGKLKDGKDIVLENGLTVFSKDVCSPSMTPPNFLILDVNEESHLELLKNNLESFEVKLSNLSVVFHLTNRRIRETDDYMNLMKIFQNFSPNCKQLILDEHFPLCNSIDLHNHQEKMNHLNGNLFPLLRIDKNQLNEMNENKKKEENIIQVVPNGHRFHLYPWFNKNTTNILNDLVQEEFSEIEKLIQLQKYPKNFVCEKQIINKNEKYEIILFGTGSACPSKYRNVSSVLVYFGEEIDEYYLLDCGEGTLYQMMKLFGHEKCKEIVRKKLKGIIVSHSHADHHLGISSFLEMSPEISLFVPKKIEEFLQLIHKNTYSKIDTIRPNQIKLNNVDLELFQVPHINDSCAVSLNGNERTIIYSGDCRPCELMKEKTKKANVIIHEATFTNELEEDAKRKMHCTINDAINNVDLSNKQYLILTHFSQRFAKISPIDQIPEKYTHQITFANDFMKLNENNFDGIHQLNSEYRSMFCKEIEELTDLQAKRMERRKRKNEMTESLIKQLREC
ncbi:hypothetical protein SNEBB_004965 [Seison nebaliae]|nr:hypothetical protein SNEBB_004965 [Seison nebaliae]